MNEYNRQVERVENQVEEGRERVRLHRLHRLNMAERRRVEVPENQTDDLQRRLDALRPDPERVTDAEVTDDLETRLEALREDPQQVERVQATEVPDDLQRRLDELTNDTTMSTLTAAYRADPNQAAVAGADPNLTAAFRAERQQSALEAMVNRQTLEAIENRRAIEEGRITQGML